MIVVTVIIAISLTPTIFSAIWTDAFACQSYNTSKTDIDVYTGSTCALLSCCTVAMTGTAKTLMQLVPFIYVGAVIIAGIIVAKTTAM
jgi:hypothetical protein